MADIIVQPKVLNADGTTYDNLIMQQSENATNAIKNNDGSYSGFVSDNNILKVGDEIVSKKKILWSNSLGFGITDMEQTITLTDGTYSAGDVLEICWGGPSFDGTRYDKFRIGTIGGANSAGVLHMINFSSSGDILYIGQALMYTTKPDKIKFSPCRRVILSDLETSGNTVKTLGTGTDAYYVYEISKIE